MASLLRRRGSDSDDALCDQPLVPVADAVMTNVWRWFAIHSWAAKSLSALAAVILLVGGLAAGIHEAGRGPVGAGGIDAQTIAARVSTSRHSAVGVVRALGPGEFLVRNQFGVVFTIRWGTDSQFRAAGKQIRPSALRVGDRVLVVGSPGPDGSLHASIVTIRARPGASAAQGQKRDAPLPAQPRAVPPSSVQ